MADGEKVSTDGYSILDFDALREELTPEIIAQYDKDHLPKWVTVFNKEK